jgi:4a-hydroxytetrahydrobiopterin dehydratase
VSESTLARKRCVPCDGNTPTLGPEEVTRLSAEVPGWRVEEGRRLGRAIRFKDFAGPMRLANRIATVADAEGHHPDLHVHWGRLEIEITTHAVKGLTENDFILAAKIDQLLQSNSAAAG